MTRPIVYIGDATSPQAAAELRSAGFELVNMDAQRRARDLPRIEPDPITGRDEYFGSFQNPAARRATSGALLGVYGIGSPPVAIDFEASARFGRVAPIDRFALSPAAQYFAAAMPDSSFDGPAPEMFTSGPLPPITASGADPSALTFCAWEMRHSAAFTESGAHLLEIIEASAEGVIDDDLQNEAGRSGLRRYLARVHTWANTMPDQNPEPTAEEYAQFYPGEV